MTKSVTECLAKHNIIMFLLSIVDKCGFRSMLMAFNPSNELPTKSYFSHTAIPALYCEVRSKIAQDFRSVYRLMVITSYRAIYQLHT